MIPAAVVMMPQAPELHGYYPKEKLAAFVAQIDGIAGNHSAKFISAFDWLDESKFADGMHPTSDGATVFSTRLSRELLVPSLTGDRQARRQDK
jgi:hypothetical protein